MIRDFRKEQSGVAAVEFALILPVMITLFFGLVETTLALICRADVSQMASTTADLISQVDAASASDISNVYAAAGVILYPYYSGGTTGKPTIRITSIVYDGKSPLPASTGTVQWSCTQTGTGTLYPPSRSQSDTVTFPQPLITTATGSVIMAEVAYNYSSPTTQTIVGDINMSNNFYTKPRRIAQIPKPPSCP
jgi:Flp pilus assembly protein TadG